MITWNKQKSGNYSTEIGDLKVLLKEYPEHWWLSMGIRSYSKDMSQSMMRPPVNIIQFEKPCDDEQVILRANDYLGKFIAKITNDFSA